MVTTGRKATDIWPSHLTIELLCDWLFKNWGYRELTKHEVLSEDLDHDNIVMEKLKEFAEKYDEILSPKEVNIFLTFHTILLPSKNP